MPLLRRRKTQPKIQTAIAVGRELYIDADDMSPAFRSTLERDFRGLQTGAQGVSDYGLTQAIQMVVPMAACLNWLANTARGVPLAVNNRQGVQLDYAPFRYFFEAQAAGILSDSIRSLNVWGKVFLRKLYNNNGYGTPGSVPTGLQFINPNNIRQDVDSHTGRITGYTLYRTHEQLQPEQVIYASLFSYSGDGNPLSPTESAFIEAGIEAGIATHAAAFFFNQALPLGIVSFDPPLSAGEFEQQKLEWRMNYKGAARAHKTAILNGKLTFTPIQANLKDLALDSLDDSAKQKICAAYGIIPAVIGLGDVSAGLNARSTFEDTEHACIRNTVLPEVGIITEALTQQWAQLDFSPPDFYSIAVDTQHVPALSEFNDSKVNLTKALTDTGAIGFDEQLETLGLPIRENSDERVYLRENTAQPLNLWNAGAISLPMFYRLVGLPIENVPPVWRIDGKTIPAAGVLEFATKNAAPPTPPPSPFGLPAPAAPAFIDTPIKPPPFLLPEKVADNRAAPPAILAVSFANHELVKMARREAAKLVADLPGITWFEDSDCRLDLLGLPNCTPEKLAAIVQSLSIPIPEKLELWTGKLALRAGVVYLDLLPTEAMTTLRNAVAFDLAEKYGVESRALSPFGLRLCAGEGIDRARLAEPLASRPLVVSNLSLYSEDKLIHQWLANRVTEAQRKELRQWQEKIRTGERRGKEYEFEVRHLPENVAIYIRSELAKPDADSFTIFTQARTLLEQRAIQATRLDYELFVEALLQDAVSGKLERGRANTLLRSENERFIKLAFRDGLIDGGILDGELGEEDAATIDGLIEQSNGFVPGLLAQIYDVGLSQEQLIGKPAMWYSGTLHPAYMSGLMSANSNGMFECVRIAPSEEACPDCDRIEGQIHRLRDWSAHNLLVPHPGQATKCGGFKCHHILAPTKARAKGNFLRSLMMTPDELAAWNETQHPRDPSGKFAPSGGGGGGGKGKDKGEGDEKKPKPPKKPKEPKQEKPASDYQTIDNDDIEFSKSWEESELGKMAGGGEQAKESIDAIRSYTGKGFVDINQQLRGASGENGMFAEQIRAIDRVTDKRGLDRDIITYRCEFGEGLPKMGRLSDDEFKNLAGTVIHDRAFTSTTIDRWRVTQYIKGNYTYEFHIPARTRGAYIASVSQNREEWEFLLGRGNSYRIQETRIEPWTRDRHLVLEVVPDG